MAGSAWTNQLINLLIIAAQSGFSGVFVYNPAPGTGNLIASVASAAGTDPYGNPYEEGIAAYEKLAGITYAIQMGEANFGGSLVPGLFIHVIGGGSAAFADPSFTGTGLSSGSSAILSSGQANSGSSVSGIQATDSTGSGVAGGEVAIVAGLTSVQQALTVGGNATLSGSANTLSSTAITTIPTAAPSRTNLGAVWNATTAGQCNQNFVNIINALGSVGIFL
jgi:hypothetical protein